MTTPADQLKDLFDSKDDKGKLDFEKHIVTRLDLNRQEILALQMDQIENPSPENARNIAVLEVRASQYREVMQYIAPEIARIHEQTQGQEQTQQNDQVEQGVQADPGQKKFPKWVAYTAIATTGPFAAVLLIPKVKDAVTEKFGTPVQDASDQEGPKSQQTKKWYQPTVKKAIVGLVAVGVLSQGGRWYNDQQAEQENLEQDPNGQVVGIPTPTIPEGYCEIEPGEGLLEYEAEMALLEAEGDLDQALLDLEIALDGYASERCTLDDIATAKEVGAQELTRLAQQPQGRGLGD